MRSFLLLILLADLQASALGQTAWFQGSGLQDSTYAMLTSNLSANGNALAGGRYGPAIVAGAFRWTTLQSEFNLPFQGASDLSGDGAVVVGAARVPVSNYVAIRWTEQEGVVPLGFLPGGDYSYASAISADGTVIAGGGTSARAPDRFEGEVFRWTAETGMQALGSPSGLFNSDVYVDRVSLDGTTIVGAGATPTSLVFHPYYWRSDTGFVSLPIGGFIDAGSSACSTHGDVIIGWGDLSNGAQPFWWTASTGLVNIGRKCSTCTYEWANCVSGDGEVAGGKVDDSSTTETAALWDAQHGWRYVKDLLQSMGVEGLDGWWLDEVMGISEDGQIIAGDGANPAGQSEPWIAFIPRAAPCPPDVNGDRVVDLSDLAALLAIYGKTSSSSSYSLGCDINRNGVIDLGDLAFLLASFGEVCP